MSDYRERLEEIEDGLAVATEEAVLSATLDKFGVDVWDLRQRLNEEVGTILIGEGLRRLEIVLEEVDQ